MRATILRERLSLDVGDLVLLEDGESRAGKHLHVVLRVVEGQAITAPICTHRGGSPSCILEPNDLPRDVLDRTSYVDYGLGRARSASAIEDKVANKRTKYFGRCQLAARRRIVARMNDELPGRILRLMGLPSAGARVLGQVLPVPVAEGDGACGPHPDLGEGTREPARGGVSPSARAAGRAGRLR